MVELRGRISIPGACGELEHRGISSGQSARLNSSCGFFLWPDDSHTAELVADALMHIDLERARDKGRPSDSPELLLLLRRAVADMLWLRGLGWAGEEPPFVADPLEWPLLVNVCRRWMGHRSLLLRSDPALRTIFEVLPLNDSSSISSVQLTESFRSIIPFITGEVGEEVVTAISRPLRPRLHRLWLDRLLSWEPVERSCNFDSADWSCNDLCLRWYCSSSLSYVSRVRLMLSYL